MHRLRHVSLPLILLLAGCDSFIAMQGQPAATALGVANGVSATLSSAASGQLVTIQNPTQLPAAVRSASKLEVAIAGTKVPVTRNTGGYFTFPIPANTTLRQDLSGNLTVTFVMDDTASQIMILKTGAPIQFGSPPVITAPSPAFLARGLNVDLTADTPASPEQYQFSWSYGMTAQGPWQPIPGEGKQLKWTPAQAGNFFLKVEAVDRKTQQPYAAITPTPVVFVTEPKDIVTTTPAAGAISRGNEVALSFNRPTALRGEHLAYAWSTCTSPQGPWTTIQATGPSIRWLPTENGSYFVKVEVSNEDRSGEVSSFISPQAVVFVNEGAPLVQLSQQSVLRGDKVRLTLGANLPADRPVNWYFARTSGANSPVLPGFTPTFTAIPGTGRTVEWVVTEAGSYNFRVDIPEASGGGIKQFITHDPVLNALEVVPIIQTDPPNEVIFSGGSTSLVLNARGIEEGRYKFNWFVSLNPSGGYIALPIDTPSEIYQKRFRWVTSFGGVDANGQQQPPTTPGSYYVRVDAQDLYGPNVYSFMSSAPVVIIQR